MSRTSVFPVAPLVKHPSSDSNTSYLSSDSNASQPNLHRQALDQDMVDWSLVFSGDSYDTPPYNSDLGDGIAAAPVPLGQHLYWDIANTPESPPTAPITPWGQNTITNPSGEYEKMPRAPIPWVPDRHYSDPIAVTKSAHEDRRKIQNRSAQRAFRDRQKRQSADLAVEVSRLKEDNDHLRAQLEEIHAGLGLLQRGIIEHIDVKSVGGSSQRLYRSETAK